MARLEDITVGSKVKGLANNEAATVVAVQWYGNAVLEVTFKDSKCFRVFPKDFIFYHAANCLEKRPNFDYN